MRFGSVCSGIEAASVAWNPLGWEAAWVSEIEPFPCAVLAHHYPDVPNLGDMTLLPEKIKSGEVEAPDVFCGGTPCQSFSVAGKRQSLGDARGNLSLTFCEIANAIDDIRGSTGQQPTIIFWENVPGVLSAADNAFGCFLGELAGESVPIEPSGGKWTNAGCVFGPQRTVAWRVFDAQYFGVAQRRRRVFVVASARDGFDPAAVLFEFEGMRRDTAPSREARKETAGSIRTGIASGSDQDLMATLCAKDNEKWGCNQWVKEGKAIIQPAYGIPGNWIGRAPENGGNAVEPMHDVAPCLTKTDKHGVAHPIPFQHTADCLTAAYGTKWNGNASADNGSLFANHNTAVRRLTPIECERLQGFPEINETIRVEICFDHQKSVVNVEIKCRKSQSNALSVGGFKSKQLVSIANWNSNTNQVGQEPLVALHVHQQSGERSLALHNAQKLTTFASSAEKPSSSHLFTQTESFAAPLARIQQTLALTASIGKEASHPSITLSLTEPHGNQSVGTFGGVTEACVSDVNCAANEARFTISSLGRVTVTCDSQIATLLCSVMTATSGFIQNGILPESFSVELTTQSGYTNIPWRKKEESPDGPRYKALGNSWAVPNVRWIGKRIQAAIESS